MSAAKKERRNCEKCGKQFRSKTKKKTLCDDCIRQSANGKIIGKVGDAIIVHA